MACAWLPVTSRGLQPKNVLENGVEKDATLFYTCQWGSCSKPPGTRTPLPRLPEPGYSGWSNSIRLPNGSSA